MTQPAVEADTALSEQHIAFLEREADHFFQGEMAHERRASWLLALASGLLLALWRFTTTDGARTLNGPAFAFMLATLAALVLAVALSLWALWPLGGGARPSLLRPWPRRSGWDAPGDLPPIARRFRASAAALAWSHYVGHRRRAVVKGRRVVCVTLALAASLLTGTIGVLVSMFS